MGPCQIWCGQQAFFGFHPIELVTLSLTIMTWGEITGGAAVSAMYGSPTLNVNTERDQ